MSPTRSGNSARVKPRGKFHPGMAKGKEGPPSRTQTSNFFFRDKQVEIFKVLHLSAKQLGVVPLSCQSHYLDKYIIKVI